MSLRRVRWYGLMLPDVGPVPPSRVGAVPYSAKMARKKKTIEQHIAVFGESGSGKTVLLSSFFGSMRKPGQLDERPFDFVADKPAQGTRLLQRYYEMRDDAKVPPANRHKADSYKFSLKLKAGERQTGDVRSDVVKMVWHDYPGEWFEQEVSGATEAQRRVDLFRTLLASDVALLLVDGQRLLDNAGQEERYLGQLFGSFSNGLLALKDDLLDDGEQLVQFPRIWILALSKADLLPTMTASTFSELVTRTAGHHLNEFRAVLEGFVAGDEALSVGEDVMVLSSAKFEPGQIDMDERVGVDLLLPLAAVLPFERHLRWAKNKELPAKVARELLSNSEDVLKVLAWAGGALKLLKVPGPLGIVANAAGVLLSASAISEIVNMADDKLEAVHENAIRKKNVLGAVLTQFRMDLDRAEKDGVLLRGDHS